MVGFVIFLAIAVVVLLFVNGHVGAGLCGAFAILAGCAGLKEHLARKRSADLTARFGADAAARIVSNLIWQGATADMIVESIGRPVDVDEKVFKQKTKHTFKYCQTGKNKFALRVTFEDGMCTGWDDKR